MNIEKIILSFLFISLMYFGITSCNLFGTPTGGYDCGPEGCGGPQETEFDYVVP